MEPQNWRSNWPWVLKVPDRSADAVQAWAGLSCDVCVMGQASRLTKDAAVSKHMQHMPVSADSVTS